MIQSTSEHQGIQVLIMNFKKDVILMQSSKIQEVY